MHAFVIIEGKNKTEVGIIVKSVEVHNKIRKTQNKQNNTFKLMNLYLLFSFVISILFRCFFAEYYHDIVFYPDELRYYSIARSLFEHHSIEIYNLKNDFQKILYSVVIMPAFLADDSVVRFQIITLINSILVSSGVFPVYLFAKKYHLKTSSTMFCCILYLCSSDLCYSCSFMSENLFLPMALWAILLMMKGLEYADTAVEDKERLVKHKYCLYSFFTGFYLWLLYLCKEVAAVFIIAYELYCAFRVIKHYIISKNNDRTAAIRIFPIISGAILIMGFATPFIITKLTIFQGLGNSYDQQDMSVLSDSFNLYYLYYGFIYFLLMSVLAYTVFPFLISVLNRKKMETTARHTFYFLLLLLVLSAAVISFTITARENNGETLPRVHLRYTCYLFIPMVILMFHSIEHMTRINGKRLLAFSTGLLAWFFYYFIFEYHQVVQSGEFVDQTQLQFLTWNTTTSYQIIVMLVYAAITITGAVLLIKHKRAGVTVIALILMTLSLVNSILTTYGWRKLNGLSEEQQKEAVFLTDLVEENSDKSFLVLCPYRSSDPLIDTYAQEDNVFQIRINSLEDYVSEIGNGANKWEDAAPYLLNVSFDQVYDSLNRVDYIITEEFSQITIDEDDYTLVSGPMEYPKVYKINDPEHMPNISVNSVTITQDDLDAK